MAHYLKQSKYTGNYIPDLKNGELKERFIEAATRYCTDRTRSNHRKMNIAFNECRKETLKGDIDSSIDTIQADLIKIVNRSNAINNKFPKTSS